MLEIGADLSKVREVGLRVCDEQRDLVDGGE